jgi:hypothetical protein
MSSHLGFKFLVSANLFASTLFVINTNSVQHEMKELIKQQTIHLEAMKRELEAMNARQTQGSKGWAWPFTKQLK